MKKNKLKNNQKVCRKNWKLTTPFVPFEGKPELCLTEENLAFIIKKQIPLSSLPVAHIEQIRAFFLETPLSDVLTFARKYNISFLLLKNYFFKYVKNPKMKQAFEIEKLWNRV